MAVDYLSALNKNGTGMNLSEIATSLVEAETMPKKEMANKKISDAEVAISAFGELANQINTLDQTLSIARQQAAMSAFSGNSAVSIEIDSASDVKAMTATIDVQKLAQPQVLEFKGFSDINAPIDGGTLQVSFGSWSDDVPPQFTDNGRASGGTWSFDDNATLQDFVIKINKTSGMTAELINVGDGTYSVAVTTLSGADNSVNFTANSTSTAGNAITLSMFDTNADISTVQVKSAENAEFSYNGIAISRTTNEIDDLVDGTTLTLNATTTSPANVSIQTNAKSAFDVMDAMLLQLNIVNQFMIEMTKKGQTPEESGSLAGNSGADIMKREYQSVLSSGFEGFGDRSMYLSDFGVRTERDGTMTLDYNKFMRTFNDNPASFDALLQDGLSADVDGFTFISKPELGTSQNFEFKRDAVTGEATLDGSTLSQVETDNGKVTFQVTDGPLLGTRFSVENGVNSATIQYGRSFSSTMQTSLRGMLSGTGVLTRQETSLEDTIANQQETLSKLDDTAAMLQKRYQARFGAMELVVSQLNSTGEYLSNLVAQWNKST